MICCTLRELDRRSVRLLPVLLLSLTMAAACFGQSPPPDAALQNTLKGLSLEQLAGIEVTSVSKSPVTVTRTPAAVFVITQQDIRRSGATTLPEALRLAPGVEVAQIDSVKWAVGIRGFEGRLSKAVLVLIDGRNVYSPLFHGVYWEVQDTLMEDIDRIEVVRGPGGTIWGPDAVDGVISIITRNSRDTRGAFVQAGGGSVDQGFVSMRYGGGNGRNFSYRVYAKGSTVSPQFHWDRNEFDDWRRTQGGFRMDWDVTGHDSVTIQGDGYDGDAGESVRITTISPPGAQIVNKNAELSGANILGRWKHIFSGGSDLQVQLYYDRANRLQSNQAEYRNTTDFDLVHHITLGARNDVVWGFGARLSPASLPAVIPTYVFTPSARVDQLYSGFAQDEFQLVPNRLSVTAGAKLLHGSFTGFDLEPSGRLLWTPSEHQSFWAAVTRAVRTPSDNEDTIRSVTLRSLSPLTVSLTQGDGLFTSETVVGYELGYRQLITPTVSLDIATFYNRYNHLASLEPQASYSATDSITGQTYMVNPFVNRNGLRGTTKGFEIAPSWKPATWWRVQGSYSYLDMNLQTLPGSSDISTVTVSEGSSPRHQFGAQSFLDIRGHLEFSQTARYVSPLRIQMTPGYETVDLRLAWQGIPHLEVAITGQNLLQPHHVEYGGDPGALVGIKRSILASVTWRK